MSDRRIRIDNCPIISELQPRYITENDISLKPDLYLDKEQLSQLNFLLLLNIKLIQNNSKFVRGLLKSILNKSLDPKLTDENFSSVANVYSNANVELIAQHMKCFENFLKTDHDFCVILEDDAHVSPNIISANQLKKYLSEIIYDLPLDKPIFCDLSKSLNISMVEYTKNRTCVNSSRIHEVVPGQTQCASAYLINRSTAQHIYKLYKHSEVFMPIDYLLSFFLQKAQIRTFWCNKSIFYQGSMSGQSTSNFEVRSKSQL